MMKSCRFCAEDIQDAAKVCRHCGRSQSRRWLKIVGLCVVGFFVVAFIGAMMDARQTAAQHRSATYLADATEDQRAEALRAVIEGTGEKCPEVTATFFQGELKRVGGAFWNARCYGGRTFAILVNRDLSTRVMDCIDLRSFAHVDCFSKLPE